MLGHHMQIVQDLLLNKTDNNNSFCYSMIIIIIMEMSGPVFYNLAQSSNELGRSFQHKPSLCVKDDLSIAVFALGTLMFADFQNLINTQNLRWVVRSSVI